MKYSQMLNDYEYIQVNPDQFENVDDTRISNEITDIQNFLDSLKDSASNCVNDINTCRLATPTLPTLDPLPTRKSDSTSSSPLFMFNVIISTSGIDPDQARSWVVLLGITKHMVIEDVNADSNTIAFTAGLRPLQGIGNLGRGIGLLSAGPDIVKQSIQDYLTANPAFTATQINVAAAN